MTIDGVAGRLKWHPVKPGPARGSLFGGIDGLHIGLKIPQEPSFTEVCKWIEGRLLILQPQSVFILLRVILNRGNYNSIWPDTQRFLERLNNSNAKSLMADLCVGYCQFRTK